MDIQKIKKLRRDKIKAEDLTGQVRDRIKTSISGLKINSSAWWPVKPVSLNS